MVKLLIIINMFIILYFLFNSLKFLMKDSANDQTLFLKQLTRRMQASLFCFLSIMILGALFYT
jgi:branched-subunit amino acid transport protein AzlD